MTNVIVMERARTLIILHPEVTIKSFRQEEWSANEVKFYKMVPWACPPVLYIGGGTIVTKTLPLAENNPDYQPVEELAALLRRLGRSNVHHRDVHPGNIVKGPKGPLLIDWETAVVQDGLSYDLYGPDVSGVPVPDIHAQCTPQWWSSTEPSSIRNQWKAEIPGASVSPAP